MSESQQISQWLNHLRVLMPPTGVILIGAGSGTGEWPLLLNSWKQPNVTMVEADDGRFSHLVQAFPERDDWHFLNQVIGKEKTDVDFFVLNNSVESGLVSPETLRELWPNISLLEKQVKEALALDDLHKKASETHNWLFIDCLAGLTMLGGAKRILGNIDLILVRSLLSPAEEELTDKTGQLEIDRYLATYGFRLLTIQKERHVSIGHALYIRDPYVQIENLLKNNAATENITTDLKGQIKETSANVLLLKQKNETLNNELIDTKEQLEKLEHEKSGVNQRLSESSENIKQSKIYEETLKKKVSDLKTQIKKLQQGKTADKSSITSLSKTKENTPTNKSNAEKFSSDANLDDFLRDIEPFFYGRSITYVDIGAFIGEVFLKLHQSNAVKIREAHLYEPNPNSYNELKNNTENCDISALHTYNISISSAPGESLFGAAQSMTKKIHLPLDQERASNTFSANSCSLDQLDQIVTDRRIDILKIDVEGEELDVLKSASQFLKDQRVDVLYIEAGLNKAGTQQTYFAEIDMFLQNHSYRIFKIYEQVNEWTQDSPLLRRCNIAYMSSKFANANPFKASKEIQQLKKEVANLQTAHTDQLVC